MKIEDLKLLKCLYNELYEILRKCDPGEIYSIDFDYESDVVSVTYEYIGWGGMSEFDTYVIPFEKIIDNETLQTFIDEYRRSR